ncbi:MAG TPA: nuclear transport factor 2 family protein [Acidimicrobiales bacterium]
MTDPRPTDWPSIDCAVRNLAARYCDAVLRADAERFASCWAPDARWVVPGGDTIEGRDRITALFVKLRRPFALCVQELLSGVVEPAGEGSGLAAVATWQIREVQRRDDESTNCVLGVYHDEVREDDDGVLRFARRRFDVVYRGPLDLSGTVWPPPTA